MFEWRRYQCASPAQYTSTARPTAFRGRRSGVQRSGIMSVENFPCAATASLLLAPVRDNRPSSPSRRWDDSTSAARRDGGSTVPRHRVPVPNAAKVTEGIPCPFRHPRLTRADYCYLPLVARSNVRPAGRLSLSNPQHSQSPRCMDVAAHKQKHANRHAHAWCSSSAAAQDTI